MSRRTPAPAGGTSAAPATSDASNTAPTGAAAAPVAADADATQAAGEQPETTEPGTDPADLVEARALIAFGAHVANDVVTGSADAIADLVEQGLVDDDDAAVAYAKSLLGA